jgi:WD40-like Beta Propeller Repeat
VILHTESGGKFVILDVATGAASTILDEHGGVFPGPPQWSPHGDLIAFASGTSDVEADIYVMRPDGAGRQLFVGGPGADVSPKWSPDGSELAFWSDRDGGGIYLIGADSKNLRRIWKNDLNLKNAEAAWSPDGTQLAWLGQFLGEGNPGTDIFLMNIDGSGLVSLTNRPASAAGFRRREASDLRSTGGVRRTSPEESCALADSPEHQANYVRQAILPCPRRATTRLPARRSDRLCQGSTPKEGAMTGKRITKIKVTGIGTHPPLPLRPLVDEVLRAMERQRVAEAEAQAAGRPRDSSDACRIRPHMRR